jgi:WD40 repeat protein
VQSVAATEDNPQPCMAAGAAERLCLSPSGQQIEVSNDGSWVWDVAAAPNGKHFATASSVVQVWDALTGGRSVQCEVLAETSNEAYSYSDSWQVYSITWSLDGRMIAACSTDHKARVWDACTGKLVHELQHQGVCPLAVAWNPTGSLLATGSYDNSARVYSVATGALVHELKAHDRSVWCVQWSPDGHVLATGSWDGSVGLWDAKQWSQGLTGNAGELPPTALKVLKGHTAAVKCMAWSPDGCMIVTGSDDNTAIVWDAVAGTMKVQLAGHVNTISSVSWSPDGKILSTGSYDGTVRLHNADSGEGMQVLKGHDGVEVAPVAAVRFNPQHGHVLASGSHDGAVKVWNAATGELLQRCGGQVGSSTLSTSRGSRVHATSWSPCGQYIYSALANGRVHVAKVHL